MEAATMFDGVEAGSIHDEFNEMLAGMARDNAAQSVMLRNLHPRGFYILVDRNGAVLQKNFFCPDCHLEVTNAGAEVKHCGRVDTRPTGILAKVFQKKELQKVQWL